MSFNRTQLANADKVNGIAAVAMQTGEIDTRLLDAAERLHLLLLLNQDKKFKSMHSESLKELAEEVKADRSQAPQLATASNADSDRGTKTFSSRKKANEEWKSNPACSQVTARKVIGDHPEETCLSLDYALWEWTPSRSLGTELRLIVPVRLGGAWKELPVLMKWDISGLATVRLVSGTAVRSSPPKPAAELAKIIGGHGVTVADVASWSAPQLQEFAIAVGLMAEMDPYAIRAINGIALQYTEQADTRLVNPHAANYRFEPGQMKAAILLRQRAFDEDATRFAGTEQGKLHCNSTMIIAHELGHAVEDYDYRRVRAAKADCVNELGANYRQFGKAREVYLARLNGAPKDLERQRQAANTAEAACRAKWEILTNASDQAYAAYTAALTDPEKADRLGKTFDQVKAIERKSEGDLPRAVDLANRLKALCKVAESGIAEAVDGINQVDEHLKKLTLPMAIKNAKQHVSNAYSLLSGLAAGHPSVIPSWNELNTIMVSANKLMHRVLDELNVAGEHFRRIDSLLETVVCRTSEGEIRSKRLQDFIDFVLSLSPNDQRRVIGITPYAQENWPKYPQELFAEAYAIWLTDTARLTGVAPELTKYFATQKHLRNNP